MVNSSTGNASLQAGKHASEHKCFHGCFHNRKHPSPVAHIPAYLFAHGDLTLRELRVIAAIATFRQWPDGPAWVSPPQIEIARVAGLAPTHVRAALRRLRDDPSMLGVIEIRGIGLATEYRLYFPADAIAHMKQDRIGPVISDISRDERTESVLSAPGEQDRIGPVDVDISPDERTELVLSADENGATKIDLTSRDTLVSYQDNLDILDNRNSSISPESRANDLQLTPTSIASRSRAKTRTPECHRVVRAMREARERLLGEDLPKSWEQAQLTRATALLREKTADQIIAQMVLAYADSFWAEKIVSIAKLEEHWGRFAAKPPAPILFPVRSSAKVLPTTAETIEEFSPEELRARRRAATA